MRRESYERRHPQDFVRGVTDRQIVTDPRPESSVDDFIGPLTTTLIVAASAGATNLTVDDTTRMFATDRLTVLLDNGYLLQTTILSVSDRNHLNINNPLPWSAAIGNLVQNLTAVSPADLGAGG